MNWARLSLAACALYVASQAVAAAGTNAPTAPAAPPSITAGLPDQGVSTDTRERLASRGIAYNVIYTNDVLANIRGGLRRGFVDQGKLEAILSIDIEKLADVQGLSFFANAFQIHNTGRIRRDYVGGLNTIAAIEAVPALRLSESWLEQRFLKGNASLRVGQLAADVEFFFAALSEVFLQSDWATIAAANMPSGGPAYPLSTPGIRLKINPADNVSFLVAVFNGDPAGPGPGDEQIRNRHGLDFRFRDSALVIAEAQLRTNLRREDTGLARTMKLGGWTHRGAFEDGRFAEDNTLLADPSGSGIAARRRGNFGIYGVIEQQLYRPTGGDPASGVSIFSRVSASPSDRNLISFFVDGGIVFSGLTPRRPDDKFGASVLYSRFAGSVRAFDRDRIAFTGIPGPVRDYEANLELTYLAKIGSDWTLQPVLTYVWHPNGDGRRNAMVTGVRSIWRF